VEITLQEQMHQLFLSCGMGFVLGLWYELFRIPRLILNSGRRAVFFQDLLFFLTAAVLTFLFSLAVMDGRLRFYLFLGEAIGFASYYRTVGRLSVRFTKTVTGVIISIWKKIWEIILFLLRLLYNPIKRLFGRFNEIFQKTVNNIASFFKKRLKDTPSVLYNQERVADTATGTRPRALHKKG
jgi:spore cortex biosynthesis protein YabQ